MATPLIRVAINGYGRIGRCVLRAIYERQLEAAVEVVLINEPADLESMAYLTQYDSTHGPFPGKVGRSDTALIINGRPITVTHASSPETVDWASLNVDILIECSGAYGNRADLQRFIDSGCKRVLVSHPADSALDVDYTVVLDINDSGLNPAHKIVSNASCTTNAIIPVLAELDAAYGIKHCFLTTLHSVMNDQPMIDGYHHKDLRRTRSAMQSIVPVATGLAQGVERLLPQLAGRVKAKAIRVPILNVSAIDLMVNLKRDTLAADINSLFIQAAQRHPHTLAYTDRPHASVDFNHDPHSAIIDGSQTRTNGDGFVNVFIWFDNEWGFANRLIDITKVWAACIDADGACY
ncbi:erythrose-4-phosphate dehydrogenase [Paenalcaligenes niemegkensis]|uniref:type I glyceraldehyde-3-phosphate dehydrogenase n=1 Tax=Paenalcaligenes niemegkensis TaxID=2895469 RepID=UPI001EE7BE5A|nr:glyceraldehyde 3-phosphate dehydrogenase NAD-binding domain-containing protein [Paenalcaligenes niemegkensis]MCQ9616323.1 erythrose-4-phosphate dehydrogenase [Paenalcaligenes niemegkensis]